MGRPKGSKNSKSKVIAAANVLAQLASQLPKVSVRRSSKSKAPEKPKRNRKSKGVSKGQYKTVGYSGKRFPKAGRRNINKVFNQNGSVKQNEYGGTVTNAHAVYIGHSTCASTEVCKSLCRAIIRKLFYMRGTDLNNWEDTIPNQGTLTYSIDFTYRRNPATTTALSSFNKAISGSFSNCADQLFSELQTQLVAGDIIEPQVIRLFTQNINGGGQYVVDAEMMCQQTTIEFDIHSKLTIQNTTLAGSGATTVEDEDAENIENNPVKGYIYQRPKQWLNGLRYKNAPPTGVLPNLIADDLSGAIVFTASDLATYPTLRKPAPTPWTFGCNRISKVSLEPGQIRVAKLHFNAKMNLATAFEKLQQVFASSVDVNVAFGNAELLGFEKSLDSRSGTGRDVRLAYQIDQTIRSCLYYKAKNLSATIVNA